MEFNGEDVLKEDMIEMVDLEFKRPKYIRLLISLVLLIVFLFITIQIHVKKILNLINLNNQGFELFKYKLYISISGYMVIYMALDLLITLILLESNTDRKTNLVSLIAYKKGSRIKFCVSFSILSGALHLYEYIISNGMVIKTSEEIIVQKTRSEHIMENFSYIILSIASFLFIYLIKSIFMEILQIRMYYSHYRRRITENEENTRILDSLNRYMGSKMYDNIKQWANYVFKKLSPSSNVLTFEDLKSKIGETEAINLFRLFDTNDDNSVTASEFISVYYGVIREKYFLNKALSQKNSLYKKLNLIISVVILPIAVFISISILGYATYFSSFMSIISGVILSLSFIFSTVVGEIFRSLIFIFLVRPFEAGDNLKINNTIFIVKELGLMYSSFIKDSLVTIIPNSNIMKMEIVNYRFSDYEEKTYQFIFNIETYKKKEDELRRRIKMIVRNTRIYIGKYDILNYKILDHRKIQVDIIIYFKINFQYVRGLLQNQDKFSCLISDIIEELELKI